MTGVYDGIGRQPGELLTDRSRKLSRIAAGEIRAAHASREQRISAEQVSRAIGRLAGEKAHAALRVSWGVKYLEGQQANGDPVAVAQLPVGNRRDHAAESEERTARTRRRVAHHSIRIRLMHEQRCAGGGDDLASGTKVVEVRVGQDYRLERTVTECGEHPGGFVARIDHNSWTCAIVRDYPAVGLERSQLESPNVHIRLPSADILRVGSLCRRMGAGLADSSDCVRTRPERTTVGPAMAFDPLGRVWSSSAIRRFAVQAGLVLVALSTAFVIGIYLRTENLIMSGVRQQAESYLDLIVTTRAWNAAHGGVWIRVGPESRSNPYLRDLQVEADTSTVSGTRLTLRNPAAMTREISELTEQSQSTRFRLTSLYPVNPDSAPDSWEREQLLEFERGTTQADGSTTEQGRHVYRLMRPLFVQRDCLSCHGVQGYQEGEVRGAVSVTLDLTSVDIERRRNVFGLIALWVSVVGGVGGIMFGLVLSMVKRLERGEARLKMLATTDELTRLANRRATMERLESELARGQREATTVGVIVIDIDHFKMVNDSHGHGAGDQVLAAVSTTMNSCMRTYDLVGRIGGEEFLAVAPDIDSDELRALAERIRSQVESSSIALASGPIVRVTVSAGCAIASDADTSLERVLAQADTALYEAKAKGRNRVECA